MRRIPALSTIARLALPLILSGASLSASQAKNYLWVSIDMSRLQETQNAARHAKQSAKGPTASPPPSSSPP
jgi:hypothetical protein